MANWPGEIVNEDEFDQMPAFASQDQAQPRVQEVAPAAPTAQPQSQQFPGEVVNGDPQAQLVDTRVRGFADEAPTEAATQLSPEQTAQFYALVKDPKSTAQTLIDFAGLHGMALNNAEDIIAGRAKGVPIGDQPQYDLPNVGSDGAAGAAGRGTLDTLTFGTLSKVGAVVGGLERSLAGDGSFSEGYSRVLDNNNAAVAADEKEHPWMRIAGQLIGGLAIPTGLEGVGLRAGSEALRAGSSIQEARAAAAIAVRNRATAIGGAYGAAHGAGSADNLGDAVTGAAVEGSIGTAGGLVTGALGEALAPRFAARAAAARSAPVSEGERVAAAAQRQGVDVLPADVAGPTVRRLTSAAAQAPISAAPIINGAQRAVDQVQSVRNRFASRIGAVLNPEAAGERAADGARGFIARTGARAHALYSNAEAAATGVNVAPTQASAVLARNIRELADTPGGAEGLARLEGLQDALQNGTYSVQGIRRMRTALRDEFAGDGLRGTDIERRVNQVADAANADVISSLNAAGRQGAARQFQVADRYWRNRIRTIDDTIAPIIGKDGDLSGEQIVGKLQSAMKGNNRRFASFLSAIPADAQGDVRASLIGRIGRATKGAQNDEGTGFSLATFLSNWDDIGETAKVHLFGPESRAAMNDLATIANGARQTANYANRSNTAGGIWGNLGALAGGAAISPIAAMSGLVAQYGGGRLLSSPNFTRWLARSASTQVPTPAYISRLSRVARAEPAIANEVLQLQTRLADAFASTPARMAAQEPADESSRAQGRARQQQPETQSLQP